MTPNTEAPEIERLRIRWESRLIWRAPNWTMSFTELFDAFQSECINFSDIGRANGVSRERIRQIYIEYFAKFFEAKTGRQRKAVCSIVNQSIRIEKLKATPVTEPWLLTCLDAAKSKGITVEPLVTVDNGSPRLMKRLFLLNGKKTGFHRSKPSPVGPGPTNTHYGRLNICRYHMQTRFATVALVTDGARELIYVVPNSVLLGAHKFKLRDKGSWNVYLPWNLDPKYNADPKINLRQYVDAWGIFLNDKPS